MENKNELEQKERVYIESVCIGVIDKQKVWLNHGKYGPFLRYDFKNYKVASWYDLNKLNLETAKQIINLKIQYLEKKKKEEEEINKKCSTT
jgi:topoisomerase IA-like protein